jgi:hypothetical protein
MDLLKTSEILATKDFDLRLHLEKTQNADEDISFTHNFKRGGVV